MIDVLFLIDFMLVTRMVQLINTNTPGIGAIVSLGKIINMKHKYVNIDINGHVWLVIVILL